MLYANFKKFLRSCLLKVIIPLYPPSSVTVTYSKQLSRKMPQRREVWETTCFCFLNTQRHATSSSSSDMFKLYWCWGMLTVTWLVEWVHTASWAWQLYEPRGTIRFRPSRPLAAPWVRVRKAYRVRGRMPGWSEFILIRAMSSHSQ